MPSKPLSLADIPHPRLMLKVQETVFVFLNCDAVSEESNVPGLIALLRNLADKANRPVLTLQAEVNPLSDPQLRACFSEPTSRQFLLVGAPDHPAFASLAFMALEVGFDVFATSGTFAGNMPMGVTLYRLITAGVVLLPPHAALYELEISLSHETKTSKL